MAKGEGSKAADINSKTMLGVVMALMGDDARKEMELTAWRHRDTDLTYNGTKIILPADPTPMALEAAILSPRGSPPTIF